MGENAHGSRGGAPHLQENALGLRVGKQRGGPRGEKAFQDESGGGLIDDLPAVETAGASRRAWGIAGTIEQSMGVVGREAFVEELDGEAGMGLVGGRGEGLGEGLGFGGLRARRSVHVQGIADENDLNLVPADEACYRFQVGAKGGAMQGEERLRGESERIGDRETDATVTDVERESAGIGQRLGEQQGVESRVESVEGCVAGCGARVFPQGLPVKMARARRRLLYTLLSTLYPLF